MKLFTTRVYRRLGYRTTLLVCSVGMASAIGASAVSTRSTPLALIALILFVAGCFRSFTMTGLGSLAFSEVGQREMPNATALNQVTLQLTVGLGVSCASLLIDLSRTVRGAPAGGAVTPADCRLALVAMAAIGLVAVPLLMQLPHDAGAELSGHRPRRRDAGPADQSAGSDET
jgi:hypothetical protein